MTTRAQNDFLTRTGPGTPMGNLLRRYWIPALLSQEVPEPDCPPVRVKLLSERLLAFRDTPGRVGVIDEFCAHRGGRGTARILATAAPERSRVLPQRPTLAESGLTDFRSITWFGCVAPPGTPALIAERISRTWPRSSGDPRGVRGSLS